MSRSSLPITSDVIQAALGQYPLSESELSEFQTALSARHPSALRLRREARANDFPFPTDPVAWYSLGRSAVDAEIRPSRIVEYFAGDYYLQDAGSMLALAVADADTDSLNGKLICDLCAAPGGKASALLEAIGDTGFVLANEPIRSRIAPLAFNLTRTGSDRYAISSQDPEELADKLAGTFDFVLVDAPCSGQAMISRGGQTVAALSAKQIQHSAARQQRILDSAIRLLAPGGKLVYSTCTFTSAENESQIQRLIDSGIAEPEICKRVADHESQALSGCYRLWPHRDQCAGSFAASVRKTDDDCESFAYRRKKESYRPPISLDEYLSLIHI